MELHVFLMMLLHVVVFSFFLTSYIEELIEGGHKSRTVWYGAFAVLAVIQVIRVVAEYIGGVAL